MGFSEMRALRATSTAGKKHFGAFVSYLRVSTRGQGQSGLGLDAQREAVADYLNGGRWSLIDEYVEVESGANDERPSSPRPWPSAVSTTPPWSSPSSTA